jgi:uncharacterized protein
LFDEIPKPVLEKLIEAKAIVPVEENELLTVINENKDYLSNDRTTLYEIMQPSAMCQLGCYYCGQEHANHNLEQNLIEKIVERIKFKLSQSQSFKKLAIAWFGAEPLVGIKQMRTLTKAFMAVSETNSLVYEASVVTNGVSLTNNVFRELVDEMKVNKIEITLDGDKYYHDLHRYKKTGSGSFDAIFKNLLAIVNDPEFSPQKCSISIRCNVDRKNEEGVISLIKLLAKHGIDKKISYFYTMGVYSWGGNEAHKGSIKKEEYAIKEIEWIIDMFSEGFPTRSIIPKRKKAVCMTVSKSTDMYDAYGNIFSCTEVSYSPIYNNQYLFNGNVSKVDQISKDRPLGDWNDTVLEGKFQCQKCKILPVCGGSCPKSWYEGIPACPSMKFNLKEKLELTYILNKQINEAEKKFVLTEFKNRIKSKIVEPV